MTAQRLTPQQARWVELALPRVDKLAKSIALKVTHISKDELRSAGHEGLVEAALRYTPESGVPFGAWAHYRVRGAMIDAARRAAPDLRRRARALRTLQATQALLEESSKSQPAADAVDPRSLRQRVAAAAELVTQASTALLLSRLAPPDPDSVIDEGMEDAEQVVLDKEVQRTFDAAIDTCSAEDKKMLSALYFEGASMHEYAMRLGKSAATVSRAHARLVKRLGAILRSRLGPR